MGTILSIVREFIYYWFQTDDNFAPRRRSYLKHEIYKHYTEAGPIFDRYDTQRYKREHMYRTIFTQPGMHVQEMLRLFASSKSWMGPSDHFKKEIDRLAGSISLLLWSAHMINPNSGLSLKEILEQLSAIQNPLRKYLIRTCPSFVARLNSSAIFFKKLVTQRNSLNISHK